MCVGVRQQREACRLLHLHMPPGAEAAHCAGARACAAREILTLEEVAPARALSKAAGDTFQTFFSFRGNAGSPHCRIQIGRQRALYEPRYCPEALEFRWVT